MRIIFVRNGAGPANQAAELSVALNAMRIHAIYTSRTGDACETAEALAAPRGVVVGEAPLFDEIEVSEWTASGACDLEHDPAWLAYLLTYGVNGHPGGDTAHALVQRVRLGLADLACKHAAETVALVTDAEVIRAATLDALDYPPERWPEVPIDVASVTMIDWDAGHTRLARLNCPPAELANDAQSSV